MNLAGSESAGTFGNAPAERERRRRFRRTNPWLQPRMPPHPSPQRLNRLEQGHSTIHPQVSPHSAEWNSNDMKLKLSGNQRLKLHEQPAMATIFPFQRRHVIVNHLKLPEIPGTAILIFNGVTQNEPTPRKAG
jgi:hypothetical protein